MKPQCVSIPVVALAVAVLVSVTVDGQTNGNYKAPRTPWGEPDLQGTYSNRTITPFERAANVNGREFFTREEAAALEKRAQEQGGDEDARDPSEKRTTPSVDRHVAAAHSVRINVYR